MRWVLLLALAACSPGATVASDVVPIRFGARVLVIGDSLVDNAGGTDTMWWTYVGTSVLAAQMALYSGAYPETTTWTLDGHSGTGVDYILANMQTNIFDHNPTTLFFPASINDHGTGDWSVYRAKYRSVVTQVRQRLPGCEIVAVDCAFGGGEKWDSVTGWGPNSFDSAIDGAVAGFPTEGLNPQIEAVATEFGLKRWRIREQELVYEQANNATPVVSTVHGVTDGIVTVDGIHPSNPTGRQIMAGLVYPLLISIPAPTWMPIH